MAICPAALWMPVMAHGGPLGQVSILGVVFHVTAGEGDPYNEFVNPANQVSSHFGILNGQGGTVDGRLEQYVDTKYMSWAQMAGNSTYLSVETEGLPTDPLTPAQIATFGRLMAWINKVHGVPLVITDTVGQRGLITHGDGGVAWGDHIDCPGPIRAAQRQSILAAAQSPVSPAPIVNQEEPMFVASVIGEAEDFVVWSNGTKSGIQDQATLAALLAVTKQTAPQQFPATGFIASLPPNA
jgi:hypothetical protein